MAMFSNAKVKELEDALKAKDQQLATMALELVKAKDVALTATQNEVNMLKRMRQDDVALRKVEALKYAHFPHVEVGMRYLLEVGISYVRGLHSLPQGDSNTKVYKEHILPLLYKNNKLTPFVEQKIQELGVSDEVKKNMRKNLLELYGSLSEAIHYPNVSVTGLVCGGTLGLKVASAVCFLALEEEKIIPEGTEILYLDDMHQRGKFILKDGKVLPCTTTTDDVEEVEPA